MRDFELGEIAREGDTATLPVKVPEDLKFFEGHFPGDPIVPGVAQVVALAEAGARLGWPELGPVAGLRRVKFTRAIRPGDALTLRFERKGEKVAFRIAKGEHEASRGSLVFR